MLAELVSATRQAREHQQCPWVPGDAWQQQGPALCPQGLENSWERHRANCTQLCQGLLDMGLELFVEEEVGAEQAHQHHRAGAAGGHSPVQLEMCLGSF